MTAPALPNAPQIGSTGLLQQPGIAQQIAPLLEAVTQHRLVNAQLEAYRGLTEERKLKAAQQARDAQDAADAASAFYRHISGSEQRLKPAQAKEGEPPPHQGVDESSGMLIPLPQFEKGLSPQAHAYYLGMIGEHNKAIQQGFEAARSKVSAEHEQIATDIVRAGLTRDTAVRTALGKYEGRLDDPTTQRKALADVAAIDPNAAKGLADAFNVDVHTISDWKANHREFRQAIARGGVQADAKVADRLSRPADPRSPNVYCGPRRDAPTLCELH